MGKIKLQAHRGVSTEYPENTMSAFMGAICQGYEVIELDPAPTSDGKIVVLHDKTINRTGRKADGGEIEEPINIRDITYEEALTYDFGLWFSNKFRGEKIPLLSQALELAAGNDVQVKIDNKFQCFSQQEQEELFRIVRESSARTAFTCKDVEFIKLVLDKAPGARIHYDGIVTEDILQEISALVGRGQFTVWLPYQCKGTSWVKVPFADEGLSAMVKKYAQLGIWILSEYGQMEDAEGRLHADIIETTGAIKPVKRVGMRADVHMHSTFSPDGNATVGEMCQSAREKKLDLICITDHCNILKLERTEALENSVKAARKANEEYSPCPEVLAGVEIGEGFWRPEVCDRVIHHLADYDQIIGSVHVMDIGGEMTSYSRTDFSTWSDEQIHEFLEQYFDDVMRLVTESECDILAHLTNPLKYLCSKHGRKVDLSRYQEKIDKILKYIIRHGIALEINTSCKGTGYDEYMPEECIVKRYAQLGGYLVTMASDAHKTERVFRYGEEAIEMLRKYGFRNMFYFKKRFLYQYTIAE